METAVCRRGGKASQRRQLKARHDTTSHHHITIDFLRVRSEEFLHVSVRAFGHLPEATGVTGATARDTTMRTSHG